MAAFGPNEWLVEEIYQQYLADPGSVDKAWGDFFADHAPNRAPNGPATTPQKAQPPVAKAEPVAKAQPPVAKAQPIAKAQPTPPRLPSRQPTPRPAPADPRSSQAGAKPATTPVEKSDTVTLKGPAARVVSNMETSLDVPTATSVRAIPAKLLIDNRVVINNHLKRGRGGKVSFTHLIGYAIVQALKAMPVMNAAYTEVDGKPAVIRHPHVGLGLAVDVEKADGSRTLLVPCIKEADTLDFAQFLASYEALIRKVKSNKIGVDDFAGTTMSLTNPGTIGTVQSVPRLMPGQGLIVGVGSIDHPAEYQAADPHTLADLGLSKVVTITSTYDHRIIQGAESGLFLKKVHELLTGSDGFYTAVFSALGVPYEAVELRRDINPLDRESAMVQKQMQVDTVINMHRVRGHLIADLDPLRWKEPHMHTELDPATYGLTVWDLDREFFTGGLAGKDRLPLGDILGVLRDAYCRTIGVEYMHIQDPEQKHWIQEHVEGVKQVVDADEQRHILERLNAAEAFEKFLATKYVGAKRFGIEGAESAIPMLDAVLDSAADAGLDGAVMGMAHRGRLNVLSNIVGKSHQQIFREFEGAVDPESTQGSGDVKYHLGQSGKFIARSGREIEIELSANPSHLETVDPIVVGIARAKQDLINDPGSYSVLPLLVHGDAAFAGQGVVAETLQLGMIKGYRVGGTIHLVINNQLGFTTPPESARSSEYSTDIAKMVQAPILHVNGDDPEACVRVARLAFDYRQRFNKDVVIDMICYRRLGHNEGDDPSYTQPLMYKRIEAKRSVRKLYTEALVKRGDISVEEAEEALDDFQKRLQVALDETRQHAPAPGIKAKPPAPAIGVLPHIETGVDRATIERIYETMSNPPDGFTMHPKLAKQFDVRTKMFRDEGEVDWALAESMAFGSLLLEGHDIRLSGQDTRRGTFSQRHSVLVDYETGAEWAPLAHLDPDQAKFWIYDSLLSEYAALGFEYGYSVANKAAFVGWEAQFGDFVNGAQIIIDQYLVAAEDKWGQTSGLVMLLPHGFEGQGPEHSSARMERFLLLSAEDNIQVANCTTAAQYFHLLRRQMHREVRKPLVIFTPKSLLRAKSARSKVDDLTRGSFQEVLDDPTFAGDTAEVQRVVLGSGKVAHDAIAKRDEVGVPVAVVRIEQLFPWPADGLEEVLARYPNAKGLVWLQEEPENMGPWNFVKGRLYERLEDEYAIKRVSRYESGSPATGSHAVHVQEQEQIVAAALGI